MTFGEEIKSEAKMFANKNLFANPMVVKRSAPAYLPPKYKSKSRIRLVEVDGQEQASRPVTLSKKKIVVEKDTKN